jgi:hypothetical protein
VTESRPARPPLATIICIYLVVTAFIPLQILWILFWGWFHSVYIFRLPFLLPHSFMLFAICALTFAGTIALWQVRRAAFFLLAARFALSVTGLAINLPRRVTFYHRMSATLPPVVTDSIMRMTFASITAEWVLSAAIVWYVYRVTSPKRLEATAL